MSHWYYPKDLIIAGFIPQQLSILQIIIPFFSAVLFVLLIGYWLPKRQPFLLSTSNTRTRLVFLWFLTSGLIHIFVEGYFVWVGQELRFKMTFMADLWKEYAKSDSRYLTGDLTVLVVEGITAYVWGPLCILTSVLILRDDPARHLFQFAISLGQLYGDVVYYLTTMLDGSPHSNPHPFYFWFYFGKVLVNPSWFEFCLDSCAILNSVFEWCTDLKFPKN